MQGGQGKAGGRPVRGDGGNGGGRSDHIVDLFQNLLMNWKQRGGEKGIGEDSKDGVLSKKH